MALVIVPYLAFFAFLFTAGSEIEIGVGELVFNVIAVLGAPLLALAVPVDRRRDAVRPCRAARRGRPSAEPLLAEPARALTQAWETRFIGL